MKTGCEILLYRLNKKEFIRHQAWLLDMLDRCPFESVAKSIREDLNKSYEIFDKRFSRKVA